MDIKTLNFLEEEYYIYLINNWEEEVKVEEIINKLRNNKRKIRKLFNMIKKEIDLENIIEYEKELEELTILSKIDSEITDIIYLTLNNKNF